MLVLRARAGQAFTGQYTEETQESALAGVTAVAGGKVCKVPVSRDEQVRDAQPSIRPGTCRLPLSLGLRFPVYHLKFSRITVFQMFHPQYFTDYISALPSCI